MKRFIGADAGSGPRRQAVDIFVAAKSLLDPHGSTENHANTRISLNRKYLIIGSSG